MQTPREGAQRNTPRDCSGQGEGQSALCQSSAVPHVQKMAVDTASGLRQTDPRCVCVCVCVCVTRVCVCVCECVCVCVCVCV